MKTIEELGRVIWISKFLIFLAITKSVRGTLKNNILKKAF